MRAGTDPERSEGERADAPSAASLAGASKRCGEGENRYVGNMDSCFPDCVIICFWDRICQYIVVAQFIGRDILCSINRATTFDTVCSQE
jgi:hypothetical protein